MRRPFARRSRLPLFLLFLFLFLAVPTEGRAACEDDVNDPDITSLRQEGSRIVFDWTHNCFWDHSLVRWARVGWTGQVERPSDYDFSFFIFGNVRLNTVYTFSAKGCDDPWIGADTCSPHWESRNILTCGGPRTSCASFPAGVSPRRIKSAFGKCVDVHAPEQLMNGGSIQVWDCNGQDQQTWIRIGKALITKNGKCLDVHSPDQNLNGGRVQLWDCNGQPQQQWTIVSNGSIRSAAGKCLDVHAPHQLLNGGRLQVWDCNGQPQQRWNAQSW